MKIVRECIAIHKDEVFEGLITFFLKARKFTQKHFLQEQIVVFHELMSSIILSNISDKALWSTVIVNYKPLIIFAKKLHHRCLILSHLNINHNIKSSFLKYIFSLKLHELSLRKYTCFIVTKSFLKNNLVQ